MIAFGSSSNSLAISRTAWNIIRLSEELSIVSPIVFLLTIIENLLSASPGMWVFRSRICVFVKPSCGQGTVLLVVTGRPTMARTTPRIFSSMEELDPPMELDLFCREPFWSSSICSRSVVFCAFV